MTRRERNDHDGTSTRSHFTGADNRRFRVVAAFHENVGTQQCDELVRRVLIEHHDGVDRLERRENVAAFGRIPNRTLGAFESSHRFVAVDAHDESLPVPSRTEQDIDMPGMQEIEDTVREDEATTHG